MIIVHIFIAIASMAQATALFMRPSVGQLRLSYGLVAATLASGTYLVVFDGAKVLQTCLTGLVYLGFVGLLIAATQRKLAREYITKR